MLGGAGQRANSGVPYLSLAYMCRGFGCSSACRCHWEGMLRRLLGGVGPRCYSRTGAPPTLAPFVLPRLHIICAAAYQPQHLQGLTSACALYEGVLVAGNVCVGVLLQVKRANMRRPLGVASRRSIAKTGVPA